MKIDEAEADRLLRFDLDAAEREVARSVTVSLTAAQRDALISFEFNTGGLRLIDQKGRIQPSGVLRLVNDGRHLAVPEQLCRWRFDNGREVKGLIRRRVAEAALYLED
jgi:lysozyme